MFLSVSLYGPHQVAQALLPQAIWEMVRTLLTGDELSMTLIHTESRYKYTRIP